jgi:hypothetical protein
MSEKTSINEIKNFAKLKGGYLLSKNYVNNKQKLLWKCSCGNEWQTSWVDIRYRNSWCPACSSIIRVNKLRKYTFNDLYEIVKEKSGILLSKKYINYDTKLKIKCSDNHIFYLTTRQIETNNWCPECNRKTVSNQLKNILKNKNGKLIKGKIINHKSEVIIKCENNHTWKTKIHNIIYNENWCPHCSNCAKLTIEEMQKIANGRNGKCLSETYVNSKTNLLWECEKGHRWTAEPNRIKIQKSWCPICKESLGERIVSKYLQQNEIIFEKEKRFNNCRNHRKLSFDFYLPERNILIEYDGEQHFKPINFHECSNEESIQNFNNLILKDAIKNKYCTDNNIQLIRIPYTTNNIEEFLNKFI